VETLRAGARVRAGNGHATIILVKRNVFERTTRARFLTRGIASIIFNDEVNRTIEAKRNLYSLASISSACCGEHNLCKIFLKLLRTKKLINGSSTTKISTKGRRCIKISIFFSRCIPRRPMIAGMATTKVNPLLRGDTDRAGTAARMLNVQMYNPLIATTRTLPTLSPVQISPLQPREPDRYICIRNITILAAIRARYGYNTRLNINDALRALIRTGITCPTNFGT